MADPFFPQRQSNQRAQALGLDIMPATFGEGFGAAFEETLTRNPVPSALRAMGRARYREGRYVDEFGNEQVAPAVKAPLLSSEEANSRYGIKGRLTFEAETPEPVAEELFRLKQREIELQDIRRRANAGIGTALTAGVLGSLLDPLNIGLAFVPVVGQARQAALAARLGVGGGRAATGAIEGAVGAALIEPLVLSVAREEQADYTAVDSVLNIAFGTAIGGGLHFGAGFVGDRLRARAEAPALPKLIDDLPVQDQAALLRTAVAQIVEGRPVDIAPVLDATPAFRVNQEIIAAVQAATQPDGKVSVAGVLRDVEPGALNNLPKGVNRIVSRLVDENQFKDAEIALRDLIGTQESVNADFRAAVNKTGDSFDLPAVFKHDGRFYLRDGHHRVIAAASEGQPAVKVRLFDIDEARGLTTPVAAEQGSLFSPVDQGIADPQVLASRMQAKEARLREAVDKAHEAYVDPVDQKGMAEAEARVAAESKTVDIDDEVSRVEQEVNELETYLPEGTEPSQAVKDAAKEANLFARAWKAAAACGMRKA